MDIGIHVSLWTPEWSSSFIDGIDYAADIGFSCVEIPIMNPKKFPISRIKKHLSCNNLNVYCGTGLNPSTDIGSEDETIRDNGISHLLSCIEICHEIGASSLGGVIHSPWGMRGTRSNRYFENVSNSLALVAEEASKLSISLALECINRYENSFLNTVSQGLSILQSVGKSNLGLHLDTYHMNIEEKNISEAIIRCGKNLMRLHLSENDRGYPGNGSLDWDSIIRAAKTTGFQGPWIIESYVDPSFPASADVCVWRTIEIDKKEALAQSLNFIRNLIFSD